MVFFKFEAIAHRIPPRNTRGAIVSAIAALTAYRRARRGNCKLSNDGVEDFRVCQDDAASSKSACGFWDNLKMLSHTINPSSRAATSASSRVSIRLRMLEGRMVTPCAVAMSVPCKFL